MTDLVAAGAAAKGAVSMLAMLAAQGTVLALVAWLLLRVLRAGPAFGAALWLVVLAKFALPWGPAMPWSLSDVIAYLRHDEVAAAISLIPLGSGAEATASVWPALGWLALAGVWAAGTLIILVRAVRVSRATLASARMAQPAPDAARTHLAMLAASVKVRAPRLAIGDAATGPYVVGVLRPIIVIPAALLEDPILLRAALLHELAHVRRKDAIARIVQVLATAMFFWWPVVRLIGRRLDLCREAACDAWALESNAISRPAYARLLVKMAGLRTAAAPALASPRTLDARVAAVLGAPVRARVGFAGKIVVAAWAVMALGGARSAAARGEKEVCVFTPQLAEALRQAHPEADLDGDGTLSKDEACEFQAEARRRFEDQVSTLDDESAAELDQLIEQPMCCNCGAGDGLTPPTKAPTCSNQ